ncbi:putative Indeterminate(ID)-domain 7 [Tripterygium wilfordii]|uniref:Putative Indeterminate(ID)-domain 7 n=1 Tax=Tripterygium wilfordii TaxID=458696 RepID=A0A7J7BX88_TRIWF|nr:protein indeterminate-domain 7-like [Tripterygium wilfordii]KAF5726156.1 putative Indeterminate(ID)-domain 7 [Tripterygium wilfordii]
MIDGFKFVSSSPSFMMDESMSNLTSASGEVSASSGARIEIGSGYAEAPPAKKKRSLPGNPDPDSEVIALSPKSLLATNRYVCEICNKGFQRDQNLQLHRRGHNLPWKLKQRSNKEVISKKVYVCPETSCVHHDPSRALGDLTGIKKHFCRKHGEKKWKCEKCSKKYAVQSDWKAHSKICGTREYRCDCGTLFSRRDSFITHRAFCDALAEESAREITTQIQQPGTSGSQLISLQQLNTHGGHVLQELPVKREAEYNLLFNQKPGHHNNIPPWLAGEAAAAAPSPSQTSLSSPLFSSNTLDIPQPFGHQANPNPPLSHFQTPTTFPPMSATALLQKAAQMGVTMSSSNKPSPSPEPAVHRPHQVHMSEANAGTTTGGLGLSSCESGFVPNKAAASGFMELATANTAAPSSSFLHDMMTSLSSGFDGSPSFGQAFIGMLNPKRPKNTHFQESNTTTTPSKSADQSQLSRSDDSLTRDFLGLKAFSHSEFLNMVNLDHINSSSTREQQQNQNQTP